MVTCYFAAYFSKLIYSKNRASLFSFSFLFPFFLFYPFSFLFPSLSLFSFLFFFTFSFFFLSFPLSFFNLLLSCLLSFCFYPFFFCLFHYFTISFTLPFSFALFFTLPFALSFTFSSFCLWIFFILLSFAPFCFSVNFHFFSYILFFLLSFGFLSSRLPIFLSFLFPPEYTDEKMVGLPQVSDLVISLAETSFHTIQSKNWVFFTGVIWHFRRGLHKNDWWASIRINLWG